jgi:hypothetical protein
MDDNTNGFDSLSGDTTDSGTPPSFMDSEQAPPAAPDTSANQPSTTPMNGDLSTPATPAPTQPLALSPAPAPNQPISWRDVLRGALAGMAGASQTNGRGGFAQGLGAGIGAQMQDATQQQQLKTQQAEAASRVKFQDAQAANLAAETLIKDKQLHQMDENQQDAHNAASLDSVEKLKALGITPTLVVDNNHGGAEVQAGLQQLTASHGAVPPMFTINVGHQILAYDLTQLSQKPQILDQVNKVRAIQGAPAIDAQTFQGMDPKMRNEMVNSALNFGTPMPSEDALLQYNNYLKTAQAQPDSPEKAANVAMLTGITNRMQSALDAARTRADQQKAASVTATGPADAKAAGQKASATGELQKNVAEANKADRADGTAKNAGQMMVGSMPDGTMVAGTQEDLQKFGVTGVTKLPAAEQAKVVVARQLVSPNGLISNVEKDIAAFTPGELTVAAAHLNETGVSAFGSGDPRYVALRTDTKLLSTALMQAHVGSRGSESIMEHFAGLADAGKMNGETLKAAISTERRYVQEKAMLPGQSNPPPPKAPSGAGHAGKAADGTPVWQMKDGTIQDAVGNKYNPATGKKL